VTTLALTDFLLLPLLPSSLSFWNFGDGRGDGGSLKGLKREAPTSEQQDDLRAESHDVLLQQASDEYHDAKADEDDVRTDITTGDGKTHKRPLPPTSAVLTLKQHLARDAGFNLNAFISVSPQVVTSCIFCHCHSLGWLERCHCHPWKNHTGSIALARAQGWLLRDLRHNGSAEVIRCDGRAKTSQARSYHSRQAGR
jgi:hypothetical protein